MVCDSRVRCCEWWNYVVNDMWVLLFVRQIVTSLSILGSFIQRLATIHQMEYWLWNTEIGCSHLIGFVFVISKCSQHKMIQFFLREKLGNYPKSLKTKSYRGRVTRSQGINVTQWIEMRLVQVINDLSVTEPIPGDIQPSVGPGWWKIRKFLELKAFDFLIWSRNSCHWSLQLVLFFQFLHRRWSIGVDDGQSSTIDEMIWRFYDSSVSLWPSNVWMCHVSVSFSCKRDQSFLGIIIEMFPLIIVCLRVKSGCFSIECNYYWDREKRMLIFNSHSWKMSLDYPVCLFQMTFLLVFGS